MVKPTLEKFYDETTDTYDYEAFTVAMDNYGDEQRDLEWDMADQVHEQRKDERDEASNV